MNEMLGLQKEYAEAARETLGVPRADAEIDRAVYQLYDLSEEEIGIVE